MNKDVQIKKAFILSYYDYGEIIETLKKLGCYKFAMIYHDKDIFHLEKDNLNYIIHDEGEHKKNHWHICAYFNKSHRVSVIADMFNVSILDICSLNEFQAIPYLIHRFDYDKYQYKIEDVISYGINPIDFINEKDKYNFKKDSIPLRLYEYCFTFCINSTTELLIHLKQECKYDLMEWVLLNTLKTNDIVKQANYYITYNKNLPF